MKLKKIFAAAALTLFLAGCSGGLSKVDAKFLAEKFINENLISGGLKAEVLEVAKESGLWRLNVKLSDGREVKSLLSIDGKIFVPEAIYIEEVEAAVAKEKESAKQAREDLLASIPKSNKPVVELFVMSHCPFGTQAEKAIIPAIDKLGDDVDFRLSFVDYAMHGEIEVREQLQQFAISEQYPDKLIPYLKEFLVAGDSDAALAAVGLSTEDLAATIATADKEYKISENLENQELWLKNATGDPIYPRFNTHEEEGERYGVGGSPTLVVNTQKIEGAERTPASMLATICAAFETAPESCAAELSTVTPSSGFGWGEGGSGGGECS